MSTRPHRAAVAAVLAVTLSAPLDLLAQSGRREDRSRVEDDRRLDRAAGPLAAHA